MTYSILKTLFFWVKSKMTKIDDADDEYLSIMEDGVFKAMLTQKDEDSREALRSLISACLHREVSNVQVRNNELAITYLKAKSARLDVHVTFNNGESVDLEMQTSKTDDDLRKRAEYCTSLLLSGQEAKGIHYRNIKRVYQIFFLDCKLFPESDKFKRRYFYQEEEEYDRLSELSEILFYELPKLEQWFEDFQEGKIGMETLTSEQKWCLYMKYRHIEKARPLIESLCRKEEGIMKAEKSVYKVSRSYERFARMMNKRIAEMDRNSEIEYAVEEKVKEVVEEKVKEAVEKAVREAVEKAVADANKKNSIEFAKKMLDRGRPIEEIVEDTGLSMKEIKKL
jgi:predicted transposase/invertase (TIGR01784 family)